MPNAHIGGVAWRVWFRRSWRSPGVEDLGPGVVLASVILVLASVTLVHAHGGGVTWPVWSMGVGHLIMTWRVWFRLSWRGPGVGDLGPGVGDLGPGVGDLGPGVGDLE
ncbi:hypothetical protein T484DRAFT_3303930 [Baffinella frigidus]|nr:hypothetical protein T484DRAFT_3303930 [Cryptophyta sp. CCMP2293]